MNDIASNISALKKTINRHHVTILAVTKQQPPEKIKLAYEAGIEHFAENYLQEAQEKIPHLPTLDCIWHYIGTIQSKKVKKICELFDWVQTIDRLDIAKSFGKHCQTLGKHLNICIQVSLFDESQKSGILADQLEALVLEILNYPELDLRGLMTILPEHLSQQEQIQAYKSLAQLQQKLNKQFQLSMDTLSMGMSGDYLQALEAGATMIRIGQAIFGKRQ